MELESKNSVEDKKSRLHKRVVCRFWLRNACGKGDEACEFLHEMRSDAMPPCRFNPCSRAGCPYNHTAVEAKTLCPNYAAGFCSFGSACKDRHDLVEGPSPAIAVQFLLNDPIKEHLAKRASSQKAFRRDACPYQKADGWCPYFYGCAFKH